MLESDDPTKWTKQQKIEYLLDHWSDIFDPNVTSPLGVAGDGSGVPLMPKMSRHPSVVELSRCLGVLAGVSPGLFKHLKAYRCNAEWRQVRTTIKFRGPQGHMLESPGWKRERLVPSWVLRPYVERADSLITREFEGEPFIPKELWRGLTEATPA
jgi:hypothetical protein